ncbi:uncharacterized protein PFL1_04596 [Pseudozyma flocculosa PF-1]|uniref:Related to dihydrodipicolinate synthetase n=2 Tax=Pseudozyma flocculosa TaxID=84751 RepID=A0A5C3FC91_9BASI|nr:uncharacterized protein PFL1_04596 [Pseudozyma flocculosa PF-1]EPQ27852.1 hypothetical protein PFL1_04596 [Pseudozyma flocculosa PF-1]SPO41019.1 related to dihydrodipicolinate synthetase [Pseudozyma flocculosa]
MTAANGNGNGHAAATRPLHTGIYSPLVTPFDANEEIDYKAWEQHVVRVAGAGVGLVVMGTNGEASHLSTEERSQLVAAARKSLDAAGLGETPIIAGAGVGSIKETVRNCKEAAQAGADAVIVITPGYFAGALTNNRAAIKEFFVAVADASPIPVMMYNFPACASGIDLDSDLLIDISQHPNICGAKLTCAMIGKGARIVDAVQRPGFLIVTGFADILLPSMMVGLDGTICGTANIAPRVCVKLYNLIKDARANKDWAKLEEAQELQKIVSKADWVLFKGAIGGTKWALDRFYYPVGQPRRPLQPAGKEAQQMLEDNLKEIMALERQLEKAAGVTVAKA